MTHFAMDVFWKAGVHSWSGSQTEPVIDLGPYTEPIRRFLRGEQEFPDHVSLTIVALPPDSAKGLISVTRPYRGSNRNWHNFLFYIQELSFPFSVGKAVDGAIGKDCFATNPLHPVMGFDFSDEIRKVFRLMFGKARKAKSVAKYLKKDS